MERAGIDIIADAEMRRESYSTALSGVNLDNHRCFRVQYRCRAASIAGNGRP